MGNQREICGHRKQNKCLTVFFLLHCHIYVRYLYISSKFNPLMIISKKLTITASLFGVMALGIAASMPQQGPPPKLVNLKVFPKNIPFRVLDHTMDEWSASLGVHCNFCHVRNEQTKKMD